MNTILQDIIEHHIWANDRLLAFCEELSPEQLALTVTGTFGGVEETLAHVAANEEHYLQLIDSGGVATGIRSTIFRGEVPREMGSIRPVLAKTGKAWRDVVRTCPDNAMLHVEWEGKNEQLPLSDVVAQVVEHGAEHRTHIRTILATHDIAREDDDGTTAPDLTVWAWQDEREAAS